MTGGVEFDGGPEEWPKFDEFDEGPGTFTYVEVLIASRPTKFQILSTSF